MVVTFFRSARCVRIFIILLIGVSMIPGNARFLSIEVREELVTLSWETIPGHDYMVFGSPNFREWGDLTDVMPASGTSMSVDLNRSRGRFFQVLDLTLSHGWLVSKSDDELTEIVAHHESGIRMGLGTARDEEGRLGVMRSLTVSSEGGSMLIALDSMGRPSQAYSNGQLMMFDGYNEEGEVEVTLISEDGGVEFHDVEYDSSILVGNEEALENEEGVSFSKALKIAGLAIGIVGCAGAIMAAAGSGGLLVAMAVWACASPTLNLISLLLPEDNPALAYTATMLDTAACILEDDPLSKLLACGGTTIGTADIIVSGYEDFYEAQNDALVDARVRQLAEGRWSVTTPVQGSQAWTIGKDFRFLISGQSLSRNWENNGSVLIFHAPNFDYVGQFTTEDTIEGVVLYLGQFEQGTWRATRQ